MIPVNSKVPFFEKSKASSVMLRKKKKIAEASASKWIIYLYHAALINYKMEAKEHAHFLSESSD